MPITIDNSGLSGAFQVLGQAIQGNVAGRQAGAQQDEAFNRDLRGALIQQSSQARQQDYAMQRMGTEHRLSLDRLQQQSTLQQAAQEQGMIRYQQKQQFMQGLRRQQHLEGLGFEEVMDIPSKTMYAELRNKEMQLIGLMQEQRIRPEVFYQQVGSVRQQMQGIQKTVRPIQNGVPSYARPGTHHAEEFPDGDPMRQLLEDSAIVVDGKSITPMLEIEDNGRRRINTDHMKMLWEVKKAEQAHMAKQLTDYVKIQQAAGKTDTKITLDVIKELNSSIEAAGGKKFTSEEIMQEVNRRKQIIQEVSEGGGQAKPAQRTVGLPAAGEVPRPTSQAEYDALAPKTIYIGTDGKRHIKGG